MKYPTKRYQKRLCTVEEVYQILHQYLGPGTYDGSRYWYNCPFHMDRTPSLNNYETEKGARLKCLGCGWSGDVYSFVMKRTNVVFSVAVNIVHDALGFANIQSHAVKQLPGKEKITAIPAEITTRIYTELIRYTTLSISGSEYLESERGLDTKQCFRLGLRCFGDEGYFPVQNHMKKAFSELDLIAAGFYAKDRQTKEPYYSMIGFKDRILIPYHWGGQIIGLQGRAISEEQAKFGKYKTASIPTLYIPPGTEKRNEILYSYCRF